ncbi:MAG: hypothetical protein RLO81_12370, partial [Fulvivirga sp.]|uniref:hypothetical protein n=1 Tax=Fulvivirga sp. TaxID=1931237 RepID=UPI0032EB5803
MHWSSWIKTLLYSALIAASSIGCKSSMVSKTSVKSDTTLQKIDSAFAVVQKDTIVKVVAVQ